MTAAFVFGAEECLGYDVINFVGFVPWAVFVWVCKVFSRLVENVIGLKVGVHFLYELVNFGAGAIDVSLVSSVELGKSCAEVAFELDVCVCCSVVRMSQLVEKVVATLGNVWEEAFGY